MTPCWYCRSAAPTEGTDMCDRCAMEAVTRIWEAEHVPSSP